MWSIRYRRRLARCLSLSPSCAKRGRISGDPALRAHKHASSRAGRADDLPPGADQADALRRRRLSDHVAAGRISRPIPWPRSTAWARTAASARCLGPDVDIVIKPFDETNTRVRPDRIIADIKRSGGKALICLVGVQSNQFPRAVDLARQFLKAGLPVAMGGFHAAGLPVDAAGRAARDPGGHGHGHLDLRRRGRGRPARHDPARRLERHAEAALQLHGRPAGHRGRADAQPAAGGAGAQRGPQVELRSRPRLPVPVLVLHHHQRAGPQEPLPQRRRSRGDRPRELQAGHHVVLHHRRQHGPQQALGGLLRPADRAQGERGHRGVPDHPGRHPVPSHPELHPQGALGRRLSRLHRARERQSRQPAGRQEAPEQDHRIPQDAAGLAHQRRLDLGGLHPGLPRRHARIDPARHGDHQEGAAARHPRAVHADAAARLGGPPDAVEAGRVDGSRPQQVRPASSRRPSSRR